MNLKKGDTLGVWGGNHCEWLLAYIASMQIGVIMVSHIGCVGLWVWGVWVFWVWDVNWRDFVVGFFIEALKRHTEHSVSFFNYRHLTFVHLKFTFLITFITFMIIL